MQPEKEAGGTGGRVWCRAIGFSCERFGLKFGRGGSSVLRQFVPAAASDCLAGNTEELGRDRDQNPL